ncbi:MAG TPA: [protein-PII] uridylyltransferase [Jatrophihabitans sp.]
MKTPSESTIYSVRAEILARTEEVGAQLRQHLTAAYDRWLTELLPDSPGIALLAVGGLGRKEPAPYGDLDLVLLHNGKVGNVAAVADEIWYPVWDSGIGLDHSVRTVDQAIDVAAADLKATLGMLDARHIAGDPALTGLLREQVITRWRRTAPSRLAELQELARGRWSTQGDASFLLEPDLKDCRGGLRDWVGLRALASAQLVDLTPAVVHASSVLLDVRGELQRSIGRGVDVLRAEDRAPVAKTLRADDADAVLRAVNEAARAIGYATDAAWRRVALTHTPPSRSWLRRIRSESAPESLGTGRHPLAKDVVAQDGEVVLARDADPWADPILMLRVARAAAEHNLPIANYTLSRLATESAPLPQPWPDEARTEFVTLLGTGRRAVSALEALDQHGLLSRILPEWEAVRFKAQHNPVHRFTVDRHLIETAVQAGALAGDVTRPDLLLVGALLHDIGKGHPGDHSVVGHALALTAARRMGYAAADAASIAALARHHLLLPDTATRRDLDDPSTLKLVITAIDGSVDLLDLLHVLTVADAAATGPAAWSDWKSTLVRRLVLKARATLNGVEPPETEPLPEELIGLVREGESRVVIDGSDIVVVARDEPGLLSRTSGMLALHLLDVQSADVRTVEGMAVNRFRVTPRFGSFPSGELLNGELRKILTGAVDLDAKLRAKENAYATESSTASPRLLWFDDESSHATILEVRAQDAIGLLHRVTAALEQCAVDIRSARISSLGARVVDAFYLTDTAGDRLSADHQREVTEKLTMALSSAA